MDLSKLRECQKYLLQPRFNLMYRLTKNAMIIRLSDGAFIPPDPKNIDYFHYISWLTIGNIPESFDEFSDDDNPSKNVPVHRPKRFIAA